MTSSTQIKRKCGCRYTVNISGMNWTVDVEQICQHHTKQDILAWVKEAQLDIKRDLHLR